MQRLRSWPAIVFLAALAGCEHPQPAESVWVAIPPGASLEAIADSLAVHGIVKSSRNFQRYARMGRKHLDIKPGFYPLQRRMPMGKVLVLLRRGTAPVVRLVVRERSTLSEVALRIEEALDIVAESVEVAASDAGLRERVGARTETLEGYLYPTTYYVEVGASAAEVVRQMVDTFETKWEPQWDRRLDSLDMARDELVTLASIIEGEMPHEEDRPYISSVYHNRLARGMRLQADPTVVYALGERRRLSHRDLRVRSQYNTYQIDGLPPGPIGQPTAASLHAALYPAESEFFFFVARADGRHLFTRTYREHLATIRQLRARAATAGGAGD